MNDVRGLTRRQFLTLSGGSAAAIWAVQSGVGHAIQQLGALDAAAVPRLRTLPFHDDFADATLAQWNVRRAVEVLGTTTFGLARPSNDTLDRAEFLAGRGTVLGLDGPLGASTGPGLIETVDTFVFERGNYELRLVVAGSHRRDDPMPLSSLVASLPGLAASTRVPRMPDDDFLESTYEVTVHRPAISTLVLASGDAPGQAGVLLESVSLSKLS